MIRSIKVLSFLALTLSPTAFGANTTQTDSVRGDAVATATTESRSTPLFAKVSQDHFMTLVDHAYDGVGTRGLSALDHARVRRIAVATAIYEVLFESEATYDDVFAIAVQQAQSEGITLDYVGPDDIPEVMTAENPLDALMWQHDLLGALDSLHQKAWNDLMDRMSSQWPGMTQGLCDAIMGAMIFNGVDNLLDIIEVVIEVRENESEVRANESVDWQNGFVVNKSVEEWIAFTEETEELRQDADELTALDYCCAPGPGFNRGEDSPTSTETNDGEDVNDINSGKAQEDCFDRPTFYYASDANALNELVSVTNRLEQKIARLTSLSGLPRY